MDFQLKLPDLWQQQAIRLLQDGMDVVVDAPTGAGKTYIFECLVESGLLRGQAVFTVPTRALANDKRLEWKEKGWNVGITTGDLAENLGAPVLVATLETQKSRLMRGDHPDLLVVDEYQMIGDSARGMNYEMALALSSPRTQLLLLSGSVRNPESVVSWLQRMGRKAQCISHRQRPVPQEQIFVEALPDPIPKSVFGYWPRFIARALVANLDPILIFAPQRRDSERIARQIAACLPADDPLELSPSQKNLAGESLAKLLQSRVAYHHSGLNYRQRAGIIEPLAKAGQLRVVVATTGLGAGINFSMRSVLVSDREFRHGHVLEQVRPDELLQMFGRAGRRGMDECGYILVLPGKPRMEDAAPLQLKRNESLDWPGFLSAMHQAVQQRENPIEQARKLSCRLFCESPPLMGKPTTSEPGHAQTPTGALHSNKTTPTCIVEILSSNEQWERRKGPVSIAFGSALFRHRDQWKPSSQVAAALARFPFGSTCKLQKGKIPCFGKEWPIARFPEMAEAASVELSKGFRKSLRRLKNQSRLPANHLSLDALEKLLRETIPEMTGGGVFTGLAARGNLICARIDVRGIPVLTRKDSMGVFLLEAPERNIQEKTDAFQIHHSKTATTSVETPLARWRSLGLIDHRGHPTRRGLICSFFHHGEGLAIAAALETQDYPVESLTCDLANLRAGHRFEHIGDIGNRLSYICRQTYGNLTLPGYLRQGLPEDYGEGASDLVLQMDGNGRISPQLLNEDLNEGDVERMLLEWRSLLRQITHAPVLDCPRWTTLQTLASQYLGRMERDPTRIDLPPLSSRQRSGRPRPLTARQFR
jgi:hypothetical protein